MNHCIVDYYGRVVTLQELLHDLQPMLRRNLNPDAAKVMERTVEIVDELYQERAAMLHCLNRIITDLPENKDWLDPDVERMARTLLQDVEVVK